MKNEKKLNNKGFSLVELIIVIAIMAVLIAVLAPQYMRYVERGRAASDRDNVQAIVSALQVHAADTLATETLKTGTITLTNSATTTITGATGSANASYVEAINNAGLDTATTPTAGSVTLPRLTNTSTFTGVTITITVSGDTVSVVATETGATP